MDAKDIDFSKAEEVKEYFLLKLKDNYGDILTKNGLIPIERINSGEETAIEMMSLESMAEQQLYDFVFFAYEVASEALDYNESAPDHTVISQAENDELFSYASPLEQLFSQVILHYYGYDEDGMITKHFSHNDKVHITDFTKEYISHIDEDLNNFKPAISVKAGDIFNKRNPVSSIEMDLAYSPEIIYDALIDENLDIEEKRVIYDQIDRSSMSSEANAFSKMFEPVAYYLLCGKLAVSEPEFVKNITEQYKLLEYKDDIHPFIADPENDFLATIVKKIYKEAFPIVPKKEYNRGKTTKDQVPF